MAFPLRRRVLLLFLAIFPLSGCLFRSRKVENRISTAKLLTASRDELVERINSAASQIHTLNATVDIDTSVGGEVKGKITEYKQIRGYVLVRKPDMLRMIGLMPIVRNRAFDMVSNGESFKLWIPPKNKFIIGRNDVVLPSNQPLENIRPQQIYDSLLLRQISPDDIAVLENGYEEVQDPKTHKWLQQPDYELDVIGRNGHGWYLQRKIIFNRLSLEPDRQLMYDQNGYVATDTRYSDFRDYNGMKFPGVIQIWRPQEEYSIVLTMVKLQINQALTDEQFALQQPPGSQVVNLDQPRPPKPGG
jgi:outer membrane lipoprotein-sorting protein